MNRTVLTLILAAFIAAPSTLRAEGPGMLEQARTEAKDVIYQNSPLSWPEKARDWVMEAISASFPPTSGQGLAFGLAWATIFFLITRLKIRWTYRRLCLALATASVVAIVLQRSGVSWIGWPMAFITLGVSLVWLPIQPHWLTLVGYYWNGWRPGGAKGLWEAWWNMSNLTDETTSSSQAALETPPSVDTQTMALPQATPPAVTTPSTGTSTPQRCECGGVMGKVRCPLCLKPASVVDASGQPSKVRYTAKDGF